MRSYPADSPRAAARIVVLALLADGHVGSSEMAALQRHAVAARLGLAEPELREVLQHLVEDLLAGSAATWQGSAALDTDTLAGLLREVDEPQLRSSVLALSMAVADADGHLSPGEQAFLALAAQQWGLTTRQAA